MGNGHGMTYSTDDWIYEGLLEIVQAVKNCFFHGDLTCPFTTPKLKKGQIYHIQPIPMTKNDYWNIIFIGRKLSIVRVQVCHNAG
jgi:hypothetical protein